MVLQMSVVVTDVPLNVPIKDGVEPPDKYNAMGYGPLVEMSKMGAMLYGWIPFGYTHPENEKPA